MAQISAIKMAIPSKNSMITPFGFLNPALSFGLFGQNFRLDDFPFHSQVVSSTGGFFYNELDSPMNPSPSLPNRQEYTTWARNTPTLQIFKLTKR